MCICIEYMYTNHINIYMIPCVFIYVYEYGYMSIYMDYVYVYMGI